MAAAFGRAMALRALQRPRQPRWTASALLHITATNVYSLEARSGQARPEAVAWVQVAARRLRLRFHYLPKDLGNSLSMKLSWLLPLRACSLNNDLTSYLATIPSDESIRLRNHRRQGVAAIDA